MSDVPSDLKYTSTHEWVNLTEEGSVIVGITEHAQDLLGDLVYVELPEQDSEVSAGEEVSVVESVKAASDIYSPVSGTIKAVNEALADNPALINQAPYSDGWIFKLVPSDESELSQLLDADAYQQQLTDE